MIHQICLLALFWASLPFLMVANGEDLKCEGTGMNDALKDYQVIWPLNVTLPNNICAAAKEQINCLCAAINCVKTNTMAGSNVSFRVGTHRCWWDKWVGGDCKAAWAPYAHAQLAELTKIHDNDVNVRLQVQDGKVYSRSFFYRRSSDPPSTSPEKSQRSWEFSRELAANLKNLLTEC